MSHTVGSDDPGVVESLVFGAPGDHLRESGTSPHEELDDEDQLLIATLQAQPRATWREVGRALDVSASTAARRWERLTSRGVAWISAYPARLVTVVGYCWVSVAPSHRRTVAALLAANPAAYWIEELAGDFNYFVAVRADSLRQLQEAGERLQTMPGVSCMRTQVVRSVLHDGSRWQPRVAGPVDPWRPAVWGSETGESRTPSPKDQRLYSALLIDGRASYVDLAERSGLSERAVRDRLPKMLGSGHLTTRCDVSQEAVGLPVGMFLSIRGTAQGPNLIRVARRIPGVRVVSGISGSAPYLLHFWLPATGEADRVLAALHGSLPGLEVERIDFSVRSIARYGRLFGPDGRVAGLQSTAGRVTS